MGAIADHLALLPGKMVKVLSAQGREPEGPYRIRSARVERGVILLVVETPGGTIEVKADDCLMKMGPL